MGCCDYTPSPLDCKSLLVPEPWVICVLLHGRGVEFPGQADQVCSQRRL